MHTRLVNGVSAEVCSSSLLCACACFQRLPTCSFVHPWVEESQTNATAHLIKHKYRHSVPSFPNQLPLERMKRKSHLSLQVRNRNGRFKTESISVHPDKFPKIISLRLRNQRQLMSVGHFDFSALYSPFGSPLPNEHVQKQSLAAQLMSAKMPAGNIHEIWTRGINVRTSLKIFHMNLNAPQVFEKSLGNDF